MDAQFLKTFQENHVAAWNERNREKRDKLLKTIYAEDIKMYDPNSIIQSLAEVSDFIGMLQVQDPDFYFSVAKTIDSTQNGARLYGNIGTKEKPDIMNSMDFFLIENDKATHLYVFMEPAS
ncbi:nuclear transport factor 2 family protein [Dyadobacter subterraneus]|uniref:Nuclear transport factor 2 family protein n=1 Tax=Dyadobacter subterraneus TaxID=2773304 RepID=A0ABR9WEA9_9BACT|nr:nuclear transport factor 2 family protein [Dyadobacter subterraneus]MBE9463827.1 nuclear transport factor 2 family protein [Dyadobacter subterraneus]